MRPASKFLPVVVAIGLAAVVALAQPPAEPRDGGPKSSSGASPDKAAPDKAAVDALVARMLAFDKNKDGKLTRDEIADSRMQRAFDRADADHDGVVTKDELTAWATKEAAQDGGREGQGMGPPDGGPGGPGPGGFGGPGGTGRRRGPGGRGFGGFGARTKPGQLMSPTLIDTLKLTDEQKKQAAELQKHVDEQLGTILTAKQKQRLKDLQVGAAAVPVDLVQGLPVAWVDLDRVALDRGVAVAADQAGLPMVAPGTADRRAMVRRIAAGAARLDREARIPPAIAAPADLRRTEPDRRTVIARTVMVAAPVDSVAPVVRAAASDAGVAPVDLVVAAARVDSAVAAAVRWDRFFRPRSSTN